MPSWSTYAKTATPTEGGDFPDIEDGVYNVTIADISEPEEKDGMYGLKTEFFIKFEFDDIAKPNGDPIWLRHYVTLPDGFLDNGRLHKKSALYQLMAALGLDVTSDDVEVDPPSWQGTEARLMVVNKGTQADPTAIRPRIREVLPKVAKKKAQLTTAKRGATAVAEPEEEEDESPF